MVHLGAFKSQLVATTVPYIYIYFFFMSPVIGFTGVFLHVRCIPRHQFAKMFLSKCVCVACPQGYDGIPIWDSKLTWHVHEGKMVSSFPNPWNSKLAWQEDITIPIPTGLQINMECPQGYYDIKSPTPLEFRIDLECPQG